MFCYWFKYLLLTVACVCVREGHITAQQLSESQLVCVWEWERETATSQRSAQHVRNNLNRGLFANTYELHHCVCHATLFPSRLELMVKLRTILFVFTFILKAKAHDYGKGSYISDAACGVWPITMHCANWPIRADCACQKEGLCRKQSVWERRGIEDLQ